MAFLVKAMFSWNKYLKNADIGISSNFLATIFQFLSHYREILPNTIHMPNFKSTGPFKQKLQRGEGVGANLPCLSHSNLQKVRPI